MEINNKDRVDLQWFLFDAKYNQLVWSKLEARYYIIFVKPYNGWKKWGLKDQRWNEKSLEREMAFNGSGSNAKNKNKEKNHSLNSLQTTKVVSLVSIELSIFHSPWITRLYTRILHTMLGSELLPKNDGKWAHSPLEKCWEKNVGSIRSSTFHSPSITQLCTPDSTYYSRIRIST